MMLGLYAGLFLIGGATSIAFGVLWITDPPLSRERPFAIIITLIPLILTFVGIAGLLHWW
jgi:hypothetical protein